MKVAKFGGSSVANAVQLKKVSNIILSDSERKIIVVSAPGKRFDDDIKITDLLIELGDKYIEKQEYNDTLEKIMSRFSEIIDDLGISDDIYKDIKSSIVDILNSSKSNKEKLDTLKATGEDSSAKILAAYLQLQGHLASYVNPKDAGLFVHDLQGAAQINDDSFDYISELKEREGILIVPGFFGYTRDGMLMTFPRGGSDITGSLLAAGVDAHLYENFTDVDSVFVVNPTIVDNPQEITKLTYREMRELSYAGFSVFHDEALIPAFKARIPVCIKNTNNPQATGTMVVREKHLRENCVVGIASDTGFSSLYISKYLMNREIGFGRKLFQILEDENVSFEHSPSGIDDVSVIMRQDQLTLEKENNILYRIKNELDVDKVNFYHDIAIIMIVGEDMLHTVGITQRAAKAISDVNVNIEMINQGSSEVSMMFGIHADDLDKTIRSLYNEFF